MRARRRIGRARSRLCCALGECSFFGEEVCGGAEFFELCAGGFGFGVLWIAEVEGGEVDDGGGISGGEAGSGGEVFLCGGPVFLHQGDGTGEAVGGGCILVRRGEACKSLRGGGGLADCEGGWVARL